MAKRRGEQDVGEKRKALTPQQRLFMKALQEAIADSKSPVSVDQIRIQLNKSDSRVRSHIKVLMRKGYVRCVGKAKVKKYVPSMLWLEEIDVDESFDELALPCVGGYCSTPGCKRIAEDYWRDGYYCRDCIVGHDAASDTRDLRERHMLTIGPQSPAGALLEMVWPTHGEDMDENDPENPPQIDKVKSAKRSRRKRSHKTSGHRGSGDSEQESAKS